jgi:hypothetical protein
MSASQRIVLFGLFGVIALHQRRDSRSTDQGQHDRQPLLLPSRQRAVAGVALLGEPERRDQLADRVVRRCLPLPHGTRPELPRGRPARSGRSPDANI